MFQPENRAAFHHPAKSIKAFTVFESVAVESVEEEKAIYPISELNSIGKTTVQIIAILERTIYLEPKYRG